MSVLSFSFLWRVLPQTLAWLPRLHWIRFHLGISCRIRPAADPLAPTGPETPPRPPPLEFLTAVLAESSAHYLLGTVQGSQAAFIFQVNMACVAPSHNALGWVRGISRSESVPHQRRVVRDRGFRPCHLPSAHLHLRKGMHPVALWRVHVV